MITGGAECKTRILLDWNLLVQTFSTHKNAYIFDEILYKDLLKEGLENSFYHFAFPIFDFQILIGQILLSHWTE